MRVEIPVKDRPDPSDLQSGDLIWGRLPYRVVPKIAPYAPSEPQPGPMDEDEWEKEKQKVADDPNVPAEARERLARMTFQKFRELYVGQPVRVRMPYQDWRIYSGHAAIIARLGTEDDPYLVEAVRPYVRKTPYAQWLKYWHSDPLIWHGHLKLDGNLVKRVVEQALDQENRKAPFELWNFDLSDRSGFYCSKLVWWAVWQASGGIVKLDGKDPKRDWFDWYTPLQLMQSDYVEMISWPRVPFRGPWWIAEPIRWIVNGLLWLLRMLKKLWDAVLALIP